VSKNKYIYLFCVFGVFILYAFLLRPTQNHAFSLSFVDEADNFVIGDWLNRGKILYRDIFINHQPIPAIASAIIQKITRPNSTFLLVKRHREALYLFTALSFILLTFRFGYPAFLFAILYEFSKFSLLGNLFLSESLVIPPLLYLIGFLYNLIAKGNRKLNHFDMIFIPLSLLFIQFNLLPLTPFVLMTLLIVLLGIPKKKKTNFIISISLITIIFLFLLSRFIDFSWYFHDNFIINLKEFIPQQNTAPVYLSLARILLFPFILFTQTPKDLFLLLQIVSFFYIATLIYLISKKNYLLAALSYLLLVSLNLRPLPLGQFYTGFHFLPIFASFVWLTILQLDIIIKSTKKLGKVLLLTGSYAIIILFFLSFGSKEIFRQTDPNRDWYINYSSFFDYGETIKILSQPKDTLMVAPDVPLLYWHSKLFPGGRYYFIYGFMEKSKVLEQDLAGSLKNYPPTFIYAEGELNEYISFNKIAKDYQQIPQNSKPSRLYISTKNLSNISDKQWDEVKRYGFDK